MALGAFNEFALNGAAINGEGGKSYYLALDAGSVALAGSSASLLRGKKVFADAGAVALTVGSATLLRTAYQAVSAGSYTLTGQPSTGRHTYKISAGAAAVALAGGAASLTATRTLSLGAGSVASAGQNAATLCGRAVFTEAGAYDYTGFDIDMRKGIALVAGGGSVEAAGGNAITAYGRRFPVEPTAYSVSFDNAGFIRNYRITLEHGQFSSYGEVAGLFTGIFAIVLERTFKVKFEARQFSAENITSSLPVKDENRVFVVPKSSRTFAASSTGGDI